MRALGARTDVETTCYLAGGATAVLVGWRDATIDVDVVFAPENDQRLRDTFTEIEPDRYRFPAINPAAFRAAVESATRDPP